MITIKCFLPDTYYNLRKVKIISNNRIVGFIGHGETLVLNEDFREELLKFKLDYHKTEIKIPENSKDIFLILFFDIRSEFPFREIDLMFKNSLKVKIVNEEEFEKFNNNFYSARSQNPMKFDIAKVSIVLLGMFISIMFIILSFHLQKSDENDATFLFIIGIATFIGFLIILAKRKLITETQFSVRSISFGLLSMLILPFLKIEKEILIILYFISMIIIVLSLWKLKFKIKN